MSGPSSTSIQPSSAYIDAHCHLADSRFDDDRDQVLARARAAGIAAFIQGGVGPDDWHKQLQIAAPGIYSCVGMHPWWIAGHDKAACQSAFQQLCQLVPATPFLGETGLDFYQKMDPDSFPAQIYWFEQHLALAKQHDKPLVLHLVSSHEKATAIMQRQHWTGMRGIVHAFTGSWEQAQAYLDLGFLISVGGPVTRPGYKKLKRAVAQIPAEQLIVESDSPDQPPASRRGQRNEPTCILEVAQAVAELRGEAPAQVLARAAQNLRQSFGVSHD